MRIGFGLAIVTLALVGGCRSEEQMLADVRQQFTTKCTSEAKAKGDVAPGFDVARYCNCTADKALKGRSVADLEKMGEDKAAMTAAFAPAAQQCVSEQMSAVVAAQPAALAPAAGPAVPAEAAEEPAEATADDEGTE